MRYLQIDTQGQIKEKSSNKRNLANAFGLHPRDLRPIFSLRQVSTVIRRGNVFIVNFKSLKLLITKEKALIFNLENPNVQKYFVPEIQTKLKKKEETPFSLLILEAAFQGFLEGMRIKYERIEKTAETLLQTLEKAPTDETLTQLLQLKKRLSQLESRAQEAEDLVNDILEEDDEIQAFCFESSHFDEAVSIFEGGLEQAENISHQIDELNENIDDTQEIISLRLANLRNEIIRFDLIVSVITAILSILAVIVGLYGVNLKNHLENSPWAFVALTIMLFLLFFVAWRGVKTYMKKKKLL